MLIKRLFVFVMTFMAFAAPAFAAPSNIGVVLIAGTEYKEAHFMSQLTDIMQSDPNGKFIMYVGNDEQSRYQNYWFMKGSLDIPEPSPQGFMEYTASTGYDQILFLVVKDPVVDTKRTGWFGSVEEKRIAVEINGFLVSKDSLVASYSSTNEDDSKYSALRARQGAFKKSIKDIYASLKANF